MIFLTRPVAIVASAVLLSTSDASAQGASVPDIMRDVFVRGDCVATEAEIYNALEAASYGLGRVGIRIWTESPSFSQNYEVISRDPFTYRWTAGPCAGGSASAAGQSSDAGTPSASDARWDLEVLTPDRPPYLDGRAASIEQDGTALVYTCGRDQDNAALTLMGAVEAMGGPASSDEIAITLRVDGRDIARGDFQNYEGVLTSGVTAGVAAALKAGNTVTLHTPRGQRSLNFPLAGSSAAIGGAQEYCG